MLVPVAIAGDLGDFWRYAIVKGPYVERGSYSFLDGFRIVFDLWGFPPVSLHDFLYYLGNFAAPLALLGMVLTIRRASEWVLLAAFMVAAALSTYPRPQFVAAVPVFAVAIAWSLRQLIGDRIWAWPARFALGAITLLLVATAYATVLRPAVHGIREGYRVGGIAHHAGVLLTPGWRPRPGSLTASSPERIAVRTAPSCSRDMPGFSIWSRVWSTLYVTTFPSRPPSEAAIAGS